MRRVVSAGVLLVAVATGLAVHFQLPDTDATDIAGDVLYAVAAWGVAVLLAPRWSALVVGAAATAWCVAVELFQLTGIPEAIGTVFPPAMLVLGTVFDARDLVVYVSAVAVLVVLDALWHMLAADVPVAEHGGAEDTGG